jgi:hypothetical protein
MSSKRALRKRLIDAVAAVSDRFEYDGSAPHGVRVRFPGEPGQEDVGRFTMSDEFIETADEQRLLEMVKFYAEP